MKRILLSVWNFYAGGFRSMTWGRVLWMIILVKLFLLFFVLRLFFFPNFLETVTDNGNKEEYVGEELIRRAGR